MSQQSNDFWTNPAKRTGIPNKNTAQPIDQKTQQSLDFYKSIGKAQYGGQYEAFDVPEGAKVSSIEEKTNDQGQKYLDVKFSDARDQSFATKTDQALLTAGFKKPISDPNQANKNQFAVGVIASFESAFYGLGSLFNAIPTSIKENRLTFGNGWEYEGLKTPALEPTVSGAAISSVVSGVTGQGWESQEAKAVKQKNPVYMLGNVFGDVALQAGVSFASSKIVGAIRGGQVSRIGAATEKEITQGTDSGYRIGQRSTDLFVTKERVPIGQARALKQLADQTDLENIELGGSETSFRKVMGAKGQSFNIIEAGQFEDIRPAPESYIRAARGAKQGVNIIGRSKNMANQFRSNFDEFVSDRTGASLGVSSKAEKMPKIGYAGKATLTQRSMGILSDEAALADAQEIAKQSGLESFNYSTRSERVISGVRFSGQIKPEVYRQFLGNMPKDVAADWAEQIGGEPMAPLYRMSALDRAQIFGSKFMRSTRGSLTPVMDEDLAAPTAKLSNDLMPIKMDFFAVDLPSSRIGFPVGFGGYNLGAKGKAALALNNSLDSYALDAQDQSGAQSLNLEQYSRQLTGQAIAQELTTGQIQSITDLPSSPNPRIMDWGGGTDINISGPLDEGLGQKTYYKRGRKKWKIAKPREVLSLFL